MKNKAKILTVVVSVIVVGLGVTLMQPKTIDIQEPILPVEVEETHVETAIETEEIDVEEIVETEEIAVETEVEPAPEEIGEPDTIEVAEPEPVVIAEPVVVAEPVVIAEPEPVVIAEPVVVAEPVVIAEPEPVVVTEPEPVIIAEPTPVAVVEPVAEPEPIPVAETYTGQTYTTVYNGVTYTVTQEQMDAAWNGRGFSSIPDANGTMISADVFSQIKNVGVTSGVSGLTYEEGIARGNDSSRDSDTKIVWK